VPAAGRFLLQRRAMYQSNGAA